MKGLYEPVPAKDDAAGPSALAQERVSSAGGAALQVEPSSSSSTARAAQLGAACLAWLAASSGIIVINRYIMRELGFGFPMALSAMGQCTSFLFSWLICDGLRLVPPPPDTVDTHFFLTRIAPVGAAQGVGMWLSNNLYLLLTVRFEQACLQRATSSACSSTRCHCSTRVLALGLSLPRRWPSSRWRGPHCRSSPCWACGSCASRSPPGSTYRQCRSQASDAPSARLARCGTWLLWAWSSPGTAPRGDGALCRTHGHLHVVAVRRWR